MRYPRLLRWLQGAAVILPLLYLLGGAIVLLLFYRTPPDGLGNLFIFLYTLPLALLGHRLWPGQFPFMPGGYYLAHTLYFIPSVLLLAGLLWLALRALARWLARGPSHAQPGNQQ
ncbi:hypothetical protein [Chitinibacter tainanensis]|uniref:hypothetical protein n=1 Tax=Chitinibacter tainanensis TaxID=230667 RepID=UPI0004266651|nr:hypothetical protein [Chitinibacter tainanensis]